MAGGAADKVGNFLILLLGEMGAHNFLVAGLGAMTRKYPTLLHVSLARDCQIPALNGAVPN